MPRISHNRPRKISKKYKYISSKTRNIDEDGDYIMKSKKRNIDEDGDYIMKDINIDKDGDYIML